jgi:hypothetical protein
MLTLDHVIIRAADPAATLALLTERAGLPVLAEPTKAGAVTSAIARAGDIDVEVLAIGADAPEQPHGYGLGFVADRPLEQAIGEVRERGFRTSAPVSASAGHGGEIRRWRAAQVAGLLPDPFPVSTSDRPYGAVDRMTERIGSALNRVPALARAATRRAGGSMVVLTQYGFDAEALRAEHPRGPEVLEVHVGAGDHAIDWARFPLSQPSSLRIHGDEPTGITRIVLGTEGDTAPVSFACGDVVFELRPVSHPVATGGG